MVWVIFVVVLALSSTAHKEFRFVLPLLPIVNVWSGFALHCLATIMHPAMFTEDAASNVSNVGKRDRHRRPALYDAASLVYVRAKCSSTPRVLHALLVALVLINGIAAFVLSCVHQRGTIDVVNYLATVEDNAQHPVVAVHFWTPCHATPYTSFLHRRGDPIQTKQLDCSPPTMRSNWCGQHRCQGVVLPNREESQSTSFEQSPQSTLQYLYKDLGKEGEGEGATVGEVVPEFDVGGKIIVQWNWLYGGSGAKRVLPPSHVVLFDSEETEDVVVFLQKELKCIRVIDFFHSFAQGDMHASRMRARIALWRCGGGRPSVVVT